MAEHARLLVLGAGRRSIRMELEPHNEVTITTVDINPDHKPDVVMDLNVVPWPFPPNHYDEVHAYEILEHLGQQGDARALFASFYEIWDVLKPGGTLMASVPRWDSIWAWGDPSHRRVINEGTLTFLDQTAYRNVGKNAMSDFRGIWHGDFKAVLVEPGDDMLVFALEAVKPIRTVW